MADFSVDVAIIGAGTAGMAAYREALALNRSVLLIEGGSYGTTCARVGCMPSKLLIAAAEAAHNIRHASVLGVTVGPPAIDGVAVMKRVREERDRFVGFVLEAVEGFDPAHKVRARAHFLDDHTLQLSDGRTVTAGSIVIATGSRPNIPPPFQHLGGRLVVNDDLFDWQDLPDSVAVFGAGVIGLELGQALHRLGVRTTLFGRDHAVGPLTDPVVRQEAMAVFQDEFPFVPHADVISMEAGPDGVTIVYQRADGTRGEDRFEHVLVATGRRANVDTLHLENTSLTLDGRGVPVFDRLSGQCGESAIFIAGDANADVPLLHEAADEGRIAGRNAAKAPEVNRYVRRADLSVVFSDPQIMMVGETHGALTARGAPFVVGSVDYGDQGRARVMLQNKGVLRVYAEEGTARFLGAEMVGPRAEHIAHLLAWARQSNLSIPEMLERPFYHPVVEEGVRSALRAALRALKMGPEPVPRCIDCGPGG
ncbi:MAG: dihydrolipoyl dehydrogenase [Alphaproteobacteria bacterium]